MDGIAIVLFCEIYWEYECCQAVVDAKGGHMNLIILIKIKTATQVLGARSSRMGIRNGLSIEIVLVTVACQTPSF